MELKNINLLPQMIASGEITVSEGTKLLASFVCNNYPIFGLQKYDEDFRSEIFLRILEKGHNVFNTYNPQNGDFFNFCFCFVKSQIKAARKIQAKKTLEEKLIEADGKQTCLDTYYSHHIYKTDLSKTGKVPFAIKKISAEELKQGLKNHKLEKYNRSLLILAIKSAYYINDTQIQKISRIYNIDIELLYDIIQFFKEQLIEKSERVERNLESRNSTFYRHRRYQEQLYNLEETEPNNFSYEKKELEKKDDFQVNSLNKINHKLSEGFLYLRPTSNYVAEVCDICERQVNYYIKRLKKGKLNKDLKSKIDEIIDEENCDSGDFFDSDNF